MSGGTGIRLDVDDTVDFGGYYTIVLDGNRHHLDIDQNVEHFRARGPRPVDYTTFQYGADLFIKPKATGIYTIKIPSGWERLGGVADNPVIIQPTGQMAHFVLATSHMAMIRYNLRWETPTP